MPAATRAWFSFTTAACSSLPSTTRGLGERWLMGGHRSSARERRRSSDVGDGSVDEALQEAHEPVDVGEVGRHADRDPDGRHDAAVLPEEPARAARRTTSAPSRPNHFAISSAPRRWATSPAPGLQKHPVRSEMLARLASSSTRRSSTTRPSRSRTRNATVPPRSVVVGRPWISTTRATVAMAEPGHRVEQPPREAHDPPVDRVESDALEVPEADADGGNVEVVDGPVLEGPFVRTEVVAVALNGCDGDGATREPRPGQATPGGRGAPAGSRRRSGTR